MATPSVDAAALKARVDIVEVISARVPLKKQGREYIACCPFHDEKTPSFKVNRVKQIAQCFGGCNKTWDAIAFIMDYERLDFVEACRSLGWSEQAAASAPPAGGRSTKATTAGPGLAREEEPPEWVPVVPVPDDAPLPFERHVSLGKPVMVWPYFNLEGKLTHYKYRFNQATPKGQKQQKTFRPLAFFENRKTGKREWRWEGLPAPRPLYGLQKLAERPEAPFVWCEGEKASDAAQLIFPEWVSVASENGKNGVDSADWIPLKGRRGIMWGDNEPDGEAAARRAAEILQELGCSVIVMRRPNGKEKGWDAADALAEGVPAEELRRLCGPGVGFEDVPLDVFGQFETPPLRPHHVPAALREFVFDQAAMMGADPGFVLLGALVACSTLIHDDFKIQPARYNPLYLESIRLWGLLVGEPSAGKSPALSATLGHVKALNSALLKDYAAKMTDFELESAVYKKQEKKWIEGAAKVSASAREARPAAPQKPPKRRVVFEDYTKEALGEALQDNPRGLLVFQDELTGWIGSFDAYKVNNGADRAASLQLWNGGSYTIDRVSKGTIYVPNFSACIVGGIQPKAVKKIAKNLSDDGLLQRFLVVVGSPADPPQDDLRPPNLAAVKAYRELLDHLFSMAPPLDAFRLSGEASTAKEEFLNYIVGLIQVKAFSAEIGEYLGKWRSYVPRLIGLWHVLDYARQKVFPPTMVDADTARAAIAFMREYLLPHGLHFYMDIMTERSGVEHAEWIANFILSRQIALLKRRDIYNGYKRWRDLEEWQQRQALALLEYSGWIRADVPEEKKETREPKSWRVNAAVHVLFADKAKEEKARRVKEQRVLRELKEFARRSRRKEEAD